MTNYYLIDTSAMQYYFSSAPASGYYLKAYATGTTTPIAMYTDNSGGGALAKVQLDAQGYPLNSSSARFTPYVAADYKLALYSNSTDADANNINSAIFAIDTYNLISLQNADKSSLVTLAAGVANNASTKMSIAALAATTGASLVGYIGDEAGSVATTTEGALDNLSLLVPNSRWASGATLRAYGDSITKGDAVANPFPALIGTAKTSTVVNFGINNGQTHDVAVPLYSTTIGDYDNVTVAVGINNMRLSSGSSTKLRYFRDSHLALLAFAGIPANKKLMATNAAITYSGAWASNLTYTGVYSKYTLTQNDTASFTVSGSVIYVGTTGIETGGGSFKVTVDGVDKGIYSCATPGVTTGLGQGFGPKLIRIQLASGGRHAVVVTVTSATSATNNVWIDWVAGSSDAAGSRVYVGNITYMETALGVAVGGYDLYGGSDALVDTYNKVIEENCAKLANDGLYIYLIDSNSVITPASDLSQAALDHLHPTQSGYQKIADKFLSIINLGKLATMPVVYQATSLTTTEAAGYKGYPGEMTYNETAAGYFMHDGTTAGGWALRNDAQTVAAYSASIAIDASLGNQFVIAPTDGTAFTIQNPTSSVQGQRISILIRNGTGGALGVISWDTLYKLASWSNPAAGYSRTIDFVYNTANWQEVSRTTSDVPL